MTEERRNAVKGDLSDILSGIVLIGLGLFTGLPDTLNLAYPIHRSSDLRPSLILPAIGTVTLLVGLRFLAKGIGAFIRHD